MDTYDSFLNTWMAAPWMAFPWMAASWMAASNL